MTAEKRMIFWNVRKLAKEFNMPANRVARLLKSLGAKRWTAQTGGNAAKWYWEED